jgi:hypothetical protein
LWYAKDESKHDFARSQVHRQVIKSKRNL